MVFLIKFLAFVAVITFYELTLGRRGADEICREGAIVVGYD
jgi:hypothetical protein